MTKLAIIVSSRIDHGLARVLMAHLSMPAVVMVPEEPKELKPDQLSLAAFEGCTASSCSFFVDKPADEKHEAFYLGLRKYRRRRS